MKKLLLIFAVLTSLTSCQDNKSIEVVKSDLKTKNISSSEIESTKFSVFEVLGKDAFDVLQKKYQKSYSDLKDIGDFESANLYLKKTDSLLKTYDEIKDKKFAKIIAYRLANDTISKYEYFLDENLKIYSIRKLK